MATTSIALRSPPDAELSAFLPWFAPAHTHFGELTYTRVHKLPGERGLVLTYSARKAALEARQRLRAPIRHVGFARIFAGV